MLDLSINNKIVRNIPERLTELAERNNHIPPELYTTYDVKRGLRNSNGTGVLVGLTNIGDVQGYITENGKKVPIEGNLFYRGIEIRDLISGFQKDNRFGFEETCYLLLFGELPNEQELAEFTEILGENRFLPSGFTEGVILKAASNNIMNMLARSLLAYYSYDKKADDISKENVLRQSIDMIASVPTIVAYAYQALSRYYKNNSLIIHNPQPELSTAENFLHMIRPNSEYTELEAQLLDLALVLHAEHGGGNNSTFAVRVVTSTDTDTYSALAAAVGSLKGGKHGGANLRVLEMMQHLMEHVKDWKDEEEVQKYLEDILQKKTFDRSGLIYGVGHAVYTISDPRAVLLKEKAAELAKEKGLEEIFNLYTTVEKVTPLALKAVGKGETRSLVNVDFYSGFVYNALNIPPELYTPLFAIARMPGWCAHRLEELVSGGKIIRPAYKNVIGEKKYIKLADR
ncbi:MAG: citrate/2-methylcitrate synthase [Peptococcia bacterium]